MVGEEIIISLCFKKRFEEKNLPLYVFITDGAGVGKTFTTKTIVAYLQLFCAKVLNSNPVIVCAPTGTAANNINGQTLHSTLKIHSGAKRLIQHAYLNAPMCHMHQYTNMRQHLFYSTWDF